MQSMNSFLFSCYDSVVPIFSVPGGRSRSDLILIGGVSRCDLSFIRGVSRYDLSTHRGGK